MTTWFGRKAPARVPTDIVVPFRYWDDTALLRNAVVFNMTRYDVALDAEKLYDGLERLVARKGWRKLGGRLRKNVSKTAYLIRNMTETPGPLKDKVLTFYSRPKETSNTTSPSSSPKNDQQCLSRRTGTTYPSASTHLHLSFPGPARGRLW